MAILFQTGFPFDGVEAIPVLAADFPSPPTVTLFGSADDTGLRYNADCYITGGTGVVANSTTGDKLLTADWAAPEEEVFLRFYVHILELPSPTLARILRARTTGTSDIASVYINPDGTFSIGPGSSTTTSWTSTRTYLDTWVRLEWRVTSPLGGGAGVQRLRIYSGENVFGTDTTSSTQFEQSTIDPTVGFTTGVQKISFGVVGTDTTVTRYAMDAMEINDTTWPGPVVPAPEASFTPRPPSGDAPHTVDFENTSILASSYSWNFGDGSATSTAVNPTHIYSIPGRYTAELTAISADGSKQDTVSSVIVATAGVSTPVDVDWEINYEGGTAGQTFTNPLVTQLVNTGTGVYTTTGRGIIKGTTALAIDATYGAFQSSYSIATPTTQLFHRNYITVTQAPIGGPMVVAQVFSQGAALARVIVDQHGKWSLWRGGNGQYGNLNNESLAAFSHGTPIRMEWTCHIISGGTSTQQLKLFAGSNMHGTTADLTLNGDMPGTTIDEFRFGVARPCNGKVEMDATALRTIASPGPTANPKVLTGVPLSGFRAQKLTIAKGDSVQFDSRATTSATSYSWNFGGAGSSTASAPSFTFANGGTFTVTHTATNATGTSATSNLVVTAIDPLRGRAVPKVATGGVFTAEDPNATDNLVKVRVGGNWETGRFRVYKSGFWSSNDALGGNPNPTGNQGFGPGTASSGTWYGAHMGTSFTLPEAYDDTIDSFGNIDINLAYQTTRPATWTNVTQMAKVSAIDVHMVSMRMSAADWTIVRSGTTLQKTNLYNEFVTFLESIPLDMRVWITCQEEPESKVNNTAEGWPADLTMASWKDAQRMWQDAVIQVRAARTTNKQFIKYYSCLMGWTFDPASGRNPDAWSVAGLDAWGFDAYNIGPLRNARNYAQDHGMNWVVPEMGSDITDDISRRNFLLDWWIAAVPDSSTKPKSICYWNRIDIHTDGTRYDAIIYPDTLPRTAELWTALCNTGAPPTTLYP